MYLPPADFVVLEGRLCLGIRTDRSDKQGARDYLLILQGITVLLKGTQLPFPAV